MNEATENPTAVGAKESKLSIHTPGDTTPFDSETRGENNTCVKDENETC